MPLNEIEYHPFRKIGEGIPSTRMIVGTFPVYSITRPYSMLKHKKKNGSILFFYGSKKNQFWSYYQRYIDVMVNVLDNKSILNSLKNNEIAISDVIKSCERKELSPLDSGLSRITWNTNLANLIDKKIEKILCTSKAVPGAMGWLIRNILMPQGFAIDNLASNSLHQTILSANIGSNSMVNNVAFVLRKGDKVISIIAIPSPAGRGARSLKHFGYVKGAHNSGIYLHNYLEYAFNWLKK